MESLTTRVFNNGNSQAVRIPAEFRLDTDRVSISRNESGDLVIHPLRPERGVALLDALRALSEADKDFVAALEAEQAIAGAARYVSNALAQVTEPGTPPDPATFKAEAVRIGNARYWLIGQPLDEADREQVEVVFVTTDPAAVTAPAPTSIGATNIVSEPMKAPCSLRCHQVQPRPRYLMQ